MILFECRGQEGSGCQSRCREGSGVYPLFNPTTRLDWQGWTEAALERDGYNRVREIDVILVECRDRELRWLLFRVLHFRFSVFGFRVLGSGFGV